MKISRTGSGPVSGTQGATASAAAKPPAVSATGAAPATGDAATPHGIPDAEWTPHVREVVRALTAEVDRLRAELAEMRQHLDDVQAVADQDGLLPVLNRRAFVREMSRIMSFSQRYGVTAALVYFDLDGFKAINDSLGHAAGDAVLRHVATILLENVRDSDVVARLGGDEFGLILAKADGPIAENKAKALADRIADTPFRAEGDTVRLTVAYGVHVFGDGEDPDTAMDSADRAMYASKRKKKT